MAREKIEGIEEQGKVTKGGALEALRNTTGAALVALGVGVGGAALPVGVQVAEARDKGTVTDFGFDIATLPQLDLSGFDAATAPKEVVFNALPNGQKDVVALQAFLIQKGFLQIEKPTGNFGPKTREALKAYQTSLKITPTGSIDKKTYERIAQDMVAWRVEMGLESFNNKPVAKFAAMYLLSKSLGIRVDGRYGQDIEQLLATAGLKMENGLLLKATVGYLSRGDDYSFSNGATFHKRMQQFVAGLEAKYSNFPPNSFIESIGAGLVMYDVKGKDLGKVGDIMSGGNDIGDLQGGITGGTRYQGFVSTVFRLSPKAKLELTGGYFTATEKNPLDGTKGKSQGFMTSGKFSYQFNQDVQAFVIGRADESGRYGLGGGLNIKAGNGTLTPSVEWNKGLYGSKDDWKVALQFSIPLGGKSQSFMKPAFPDNQNKDIYVSGPDRIGITNPGYSMPPPDAKIVLGNKITETQTPAIGFADLVPVNGTEVTQLMVGGRTVEKRKIDAVDNPPSVGLPTIKGGVSNAILVNAGTITDADGVIAGSTGVYLYNAGGTQIGQFPGTSDIPILGLTPGTQYSIATYGKVNKRNPDGTLTPTEIVGTKLNFTTTLPDNPGFAYSGDVVSRSGSTAVVTSGYLQDPDGVRNAKAVVIEEGTNTIIQTYNLTLAVDGKSSVPQTLSLSGLNPAKQYRVYIQGELFDREQYPSGRWKELFAATGIF